MISTMCLVAWQKLSADLKAGTQEAAKDCPSSETCRRILANTSDSQAQLNQDHLIASRSKEAAPNKDLSIGLTGFSQEEALE